MGTITSPILCSSEEIAASKRRDAALSCSARAGEVALERLRVRKAEERRKAADAAHAASLQEEQRAMDEEANRAARAEQRRMRAETSFFARSGDVVGAS